MARKIDFQLGVTVDKAQLTELQQVLKQIQKDAESATGTGSIATQLSKASVEAEKLERILNQSWNGKLNQLDVSKFTDQIKKGYGSVEQLKKSFESVGRGDVFNKVQSFSLNEINNWSPHWVSDISGINYLKYATHISLSIY